MPAAPAVRPIVVLPPPPEPAPRKNLGRALVRRWPWPVAGLLAGALVAFAYHALQPGAFRSAAQVLVVRSQPEPTPGGGTKVISSEEAGTTQATLIRSRNVLEAAAKKLDDHGPFVVAPPADSAARVAFLESRFSASPDGTSNVLNLAFNSPDPADAPKYLRAIIDAHRAELASSRQPHPATPSPASKPPGTTPSPGPDPDSKALADEIARTDAAIQKARADLAAAGNEDPAAIRDRAAKSRAAAEPLAARKKEIEADLALIAKTGKDRPERVAVMKKLGVRPDPAFDPRVVPQPPDDEPTTAGASEEEVALRSAERRRAMLAERLGPEHPQIVALDKEIRRLKDVVASRKPAGEPKKAPNPPRVADLPKGADELDRHKAKLEADLAGLTGRLAAIATSVALDEETAGKVESLRAELETLQARRKTLDERLRAKADVPPKSQPAPPSVPVAVTPAAPPATYKVEELTPPSEGVKVAAAREPVLLIGGLIGLLLGSALAFAGALAEKPPASPARIGQRVGLPVLARVPRLRTDLPPDRPTTTGLDRVLASFFRPNSPEAAAIDALRTRLDAATQGHGHLALQLTGANPGDGASTLAANLAVSLARAGKRVLLVDCDFRAPRVQRLFNLRDPRTGLTAVLAGFEELKAAVRPTEVENLSLLPAGPWPALPNTILTGPKVTELLADLRQAYDFVILDTPPALDGNDAVSVGSQADGVLLVCRRSHDAEPAAEKARDRLREAGRLLGVVVNDPTDKVEPAVSGPHRVAVEADRATVAERPLPKKG